jgi:tRNA pseudouridine55 synthase
MNIEEGQILYFDKPLRWTSFNLVAKVRWMLCHRLGVKKLKVGHAGTLDPLATGVLIVCIGKATKLAESFQKAQKQYIAGVTFGATTASYDREKEVDAFYPLEGVSEEALRAVLPSFIGEQDQVAPLFSAKSVDGVRVYEIARKRYKAGLPVEDLGVLQASRINIYGLELLSYTALADTPADPVRGCAAHPSQPAVGPLPLTDPRVDTPLSGSVCRRQNPNNRINVAEVPEGLPQAEILVDCSKGTYIRALARDLGEALGSGAFLHSLRRTRNGGFTVEQALGIEDLQAIFQSI